jgi:hypothetical protein
MKVHSLLALSVLAFSSVLTGGCAVSELETDAPQAVEEDLTTSGLATRLSALEKATRGAQIKENTDYGRGFSTKKYAKGTPHTKVLTDVTGSDIRSTELGGFSSQTGQNAIKLLADTVYAEAKDLQTNGDTVASDSLKTVARALYALKTSASMFTSVKSYSHAIAEDGDLQSDTLVFTKTDGTLLVFGYTDFPF